MHAVRRSQQQPPQLGAPLALPPPPPVASAEVAASASAAAEAAVAATRDEANTLREHLRTKAAWNPGARITMVLEGDVRMRGRRSRE